MDKQTSINCTNRKRKRVACIGAGLGAAASYLTLEPSLPSNFIAPVPASSPLLCRNTQRSHLQKVQRITSCPCVVSLEAHILPPLERGTSAEALPWISWQTLAPAVIAAGAVTSRRCHSRFSRGSVRCSVILRGKKATTVENESWLNEVTGPLLLLVLAVLYGGNVPLLKAVETQAPIDLTAPEVLLLRFVTASILTLPWLLFNLDKAMAVWRPATELSFWLWAGYTFQIFGLEKTSASVAAITTALVGVTVQTLEVVIEGRSVKPLVIASSLGTIAGLSIFVTAPGAPAQPSIKSLVDRMLNLFSFLKAKSEPLPHEALLKNIPGEAIAVVGAVLFGVHVWRCNRIISAAENDTSPAGKDYELALAIVQCIVTTLFCLSLTIVDSPYSLQDQLAIAERLRPTVWLQIAACGVLCTGLPSVLELFAFKVVSPAVSSLIYCTIPLWGAVLGVVFLHDGFGPQSLLGAAIILMSSLTPSVMDMFGEKDRDEENVAQFSSEATCSINNIEEIDPTLVEEDVLVTPMEH